MSIELTMGLANLVAITGFFVRNEARLTKLETTVNLLLIGKNLK